MTGIPVKFRKGGEAMTGTYEFFSTLGGVGYVKLYLCGGMIEADTRDYFLTLDSSISADTGNYYLYGDTDLNFDIDIEKPFRVKGADAVISYALMNIVGGQTIQVTFNIYHVDMSDAETLIGTVIGDGHFYDVANEYLKKCARLTSI